MTATIDKTTDQPFHDFILANFGKTPYINTYPDFLAGGAVMVTALFIGAGLEVRPKHFYISRKSRCLRRTSLGTPIRVDK